VSESIYKAFKKSRCAVNLMMRVLHSLSMTPSVKLLLCVLCCIADPRSQQRRHSWRHFNESLIWQQIHEANICFCNLVDFFPILYTPVYFYSANDGGVMWSLRLSFILSVVLWAGLTGAFNGRQSNVVAW